MNILKEIFSSESIDRMFSFFIFLNIYNVISGVNIRENAIVIIIITIAYGVTNNFLGYKKRKLRIKNKEWIFSLLFIYKVLYLKKFVLEWWGDNEVK